MKNSHGSIRTISLFTLISLLTVIALSLSPVNAAENWKETFDEVCGKVQGADSLSDKEIAVLIEKADKIAPEIQKSDEPGKKVYLQRLKKCRAVYEFMLEARKNSGK